MGGLGHLSRSLGLTIDNIVALKGVRGDGSVFEVFEGCSDPIAWHWLRGVMTHPRQPLLVRRSLAAVETLAEHLQQAEGLSRQWSSSFVLGVPPDGSAPALMRYLVGAELAIGVFVDRSSARPCTQRLMDCATAPRTWIHAISVAAGQSEALAAVLTGAIGRLPNRYCRIAQQAINSGLFRRAVSGGQSCFGPLCDAGAAFSATADLMALRTTRLCLQHLCGHIDSRPHAALPA